MIVSLIFVGLYAHVQGSTITRTRSMGFPRHQGSSVKLSKANQAQNVQTNFALCDRTVLLKFDDVLFPSLAMSLKESVNVSVLDQINLQHKLDTFIDSISELGSIELFSSSSLSSLSSGHNFMSSILQRLWTLPAWIDKSDWMNIIFLRYFPSMETKKPEIKSEDKTNVRKAIEMFEKKGNVRSQKAEVLKGKRQALIPLKPHSFVLVTAEDKDIYEFKRLCELYPLSICRVLRVPGALSIAAYSQMLQTATSLVSRLNIEDSTDRFSVVEVPAVYIPENVKRNDTRKMVSQDRVSLDSVEEIFEDDQTAYVVHYPRSIKSALVAIEAKKLRSNDVYYKKDDLVRNRIVPDARYDSTMAKLRISLPKKSQPSRIKQRFDTSRSEVYRKRIGDTELPSYEHFRSLLDTWNRRSKQRGQFI